MMKSTKKTKATAAKSVTAEPAKTQTVKTAPSANRVLLELINPDAKSVCVAGTFNEWNPAKTPLNPLGNGHWTGGLEVKAGRYEYLFVVDGQWLPDPNAKETVQNPFGGKNSVLVVSA